MAEGVGFEPTFAFTKTVFKTVAIVHSATPPKTALVYEIDLSLATLYCTEILRQRTQP
jgi:hypothetical protein